MMASQETRTMGAERSAKIAVVTDGMWRKSLSAIRSLGKQGYQVHVFGDTRLTVGFWSRYTAKRVLAPTASTNRDAFHTALLRHLKEIKAEGGQKPVLLPMEDATMDCVVSDRQTFAELANFLIPENESFWVASDKFETMQFALRLGIPHPRTTLASDGTSLVAAVARLESSVVKPATGAGSRGVRYDAKFTQEEAQDYIDRYGAALAQQRISSAGDAIGVALLYDANKNLIAHFCHKRLRQYPNSGGPSTDRIGIGDGVFFDMSRRLVETLDWRGIAMVEWKIEPSSGVPMLMEINPRFWGSLELAVRSGVDFPALYARAAAGLPCGRPTPSLGVRCRWLLPGDVLRYLTSRPSEREGLWRFIQGLPGDAEEWDRSDLSGLAATIVCQGLAMLLPQYRKMLSR